MRSDPNIDVQVARRTTILTRLTFTRESNSISAINARRHLYGQDLIPLYPAATMARLARVFDCLPGASAIWTGLLNREKTLLHSYLAVAAAGFAGHRTGPGFSPRSITGFTTGQGRNRDIQSVTEYGLPEVEIQLISQVGTAKNV
jgi:hypothetical protein